MNCCGFLRRYKKKKIPVDQEKGPKKNKLAIWNQMYFTNSMYPYCEKQNLQSLIESSDFFVQKNVYLYDVIESGMRDMELDAFYSFYLSQAQFEKMPKSAIIHRIHYFDFKLIMELYTKLEITKHAEIKSDIILKRLQEFLNFFRFLPKYDSQTSLGYFNKPVTFYECLNVTIFEEQSITLDSQGFVSNWLQLISWYRLANVRLKDSCKELHQLMKLKRNRASAHLFNKIAESAGDLDALMANLDLNHGSAELAALRRRFSIANNVSKRLAFVPGYRCNSSALKDILSCNISEDCRLITFVVGCSYHNINICFMIQRVIVSKLECDDLFDIIVTTLRPMVVDFFYEVIRPLRIKVELDNYIASVIEGCVENFKDYVQILKETQEEKMIIENAFGHTIDLWIRTLQHCIDISLYNGQILQLFEDEAKIVITNSMAQLVRDVLQSGVLLAYKTFQKEFVTETILLQLATHPLETNNAGLFEINCAQVAYCLVSAYKIMHNRCPFPEGCLWLQESYPRREFVAFIDELRRTCGLQQLGTEAAAVDLRHSLGEVQHSLSKEMRHGLSSLTVAAQNGIELLEKARYSEDFKNS